VCVRVCVFNCGIVHAKIILLTKDILAPPGRRKIHIFFSSTFVGAIENNRTSS